MRDVFSCGFMVCVGMPLALLVGKFFEVASWWAKALTGISFGLFSAVVADFIWEIFE